MFLSPNEGQEDLGLLRAGTQGCDNFVTQNTIKLKLFIAGSAPLPLSPCGKNTVREFPASSLYGLSFLSPGKDTHSVIL